MFKSKKGIILLAVLVPMWLSSQTRIFISPAGSDVNPGTREKPFATIRKAQLAARTIAGPVVIYMLEGTYYLSRPIVFTREDSRKDHEALTLKNFDDRTVILSGGVDLHLRWKKYRNGIWQARVKRGLVFDELIVNGRVQPMARYPNFDSTARFLGGTSPDALTPERVARWSSPEGGYVHALHKFEWGDFHYRITGKTRVNELALEGGWQNNRRMGMHERYRFVENIFEELDAPGEWFYNKNTSTLYYFPPKNVELTTAQYVAPQLAQLIELRGSEEHPVNNIHIEGLTLAHTVRTFMQNREPLLRSDWTIYRGGAVVFDGAVHCSLRNCTLENLGGNAVFFNNYNRACEVSGCLIDEIGAGAVCFVGDPKAVRSPSFEYHEFVP
ncbi:MAG TPA: peptide-binding protein, partial [Bacteroidota bacterium]|nr:peptide-binding protein [Bacteroidota bacterium]